MRAQADVARWGMVALLIATAIAAAAIGYASFGRAPGAPTAPAALATADLAARAQAEPANATLWLALGERHFAAGDFAAAADAYRHATGAAPERATAWSALGEALVMASRREPMPVAARVAFRQAIALDPRDPRARYFLAVDRDLAGDHRGAIDDWLALLRETPPGAPWERDLRRTIEQVGRINRIEVADRLAMIAPPRAAGPSAADLRAAAAVPPSQQEAMARAMVARLEARLRGRPEDLDGWVMLMRSRVTLGEPGKARRAWADARAANPAAAAQLDAAAASLGIAAG
ncbi:MAG: hypothetical protein K2X76_10675 [Sphingomonas sp.]|nr:hypothetical protein [Sphingomonas sp.]